MLRARRPTRALESRPVPKIRLETMSNQSAGRSVLSRHLAILSAFEVDRAHLNLSQISKRSGVPLSSTHRLVADLVAHGLLEPHAGKTFKLGIRLWELASRTPGVIGLREVAMPHLQLVQETVRQNTQLAILDGADVLILERFTEPGAAVDIGGISTIGGRLPLHASTVGLVLLAYAGPELYEEVVRFGLPKYSAQTIGSEPELRRTLQAIRAERHIVTEGYVQEDASSLAVPVFGAAQTVVAALSIVVPRAEVSVRRYLPLLHNAAVNISSELREISAGRRPQVRADIHRFSRMVREQRSQPTG